MPWASRVLLLAAAAACLAAAAPAVRADGDPASDFLIGQDVFIPLDGTIPPAQSRLLATLLQQAKRRGFPIKVALIAKPIDLGSVAALWRQPQRYAHFLGEELFYVYRGRLLIVMPNGYGIFRRGKPFAAERKLLDTLAPPATGGLAGAAAVVVRRLAAQGGVRLAVPAVRSRARDNANRDRIKIAVIALCAAAISAFVVLLRRRRRDAGSEGAT